MVAVAGVDECMHSESEAFTTLPDVLFSKNMQPAREIFVLETSNPLRPVPEKSLWLKRLPFPSQ